MSVWYCIPSKRSISEIAPILQSWREQGYKIALWRDWNDERVPDAMADLVRPGKYPGYARAVNLLVAEVLDIYSDAEWLVTGGDDVQPGLNHAAQQIAQQCGDHFYKVNSTNRDRVAYEWSTFGVMQPTGDRWGEHRNTHTFTPRAGGIPALQMCSQCGRMEDNAIHSLGAYIDRVCGSPWMGREFCQRVNQGNGPLWPEYYHMGVDQELQAVATRLGVFWQRPDLIHLHKHWGRGVGDAKGSAANMPEFLARANSKEEWDKYKALFRAREEAGFPGSEPL